MFSFVLNPVNPIASCEIRPPRSVLRARTTQPVDKDGESGAQPEGRLGAATSHGPRAARARLNALGRQASGEDGGRGDADERPAPEVR